MGSYWEVCPSWDRKVWLTTEVYNSNKLGIRTMGEMAKESCRTAKGKKKMLINAPNYEILGNPAYAAAFQYTPI